MLNRFTLHFAICLTAMVSAGVGAAHVKLLAGLETPPVAARTLQMRENEAADKFVAVANLACGRALKSEKSFSQLRYY
jgi:hypothetical protein